MRRKAKDVVVVRVPERSAVYYPRVKRRETRDHEVEEENVLCGVPATIVPATFHTRIAHAPSHRRSKLVNSFVMLHPPRLLLSICGDHIDDG